MLNITNALRQIGVEIPDYQVTNITLDSRAVTPGSAFIALKGLSQDGARYIPKAIEQGARLILVDSQCELNELPEHCYVIKGLANSLAKLASVCYQEPSKSLALVGITGTNGKSTTSTMIANLALQLSQPSAVIGTLGWGAPDNLTPLANTTPSSVDVQAILSALLSQQNQLVAMEVSSHGLEQGRVAECDFDVCVFTNLTRDHLDYHGTMQAYGDAKKRLFTEFDARANIINADDEVGLSWLSTGSIANSFIYGQALSSETKSLSSLGYLSIEAVTYHANGMTLDWHMRYQENEYREQCFVPLFGLFNAYNLAAAIASLVCLGHEFSTLVNAAKNLTPVCGRMEPFSAQECPTMVVDYAHTPDALFQALTALQSHAPHGITCVFGCGGDRDKGKRPLMAKAAEKLANTVIITNDNPRSEDPQNIISDILAGLSEPEKALVEPDRAKAIALAFNSSPRDALILIAGKGHEDYQIVGDTVLPFSDRAVVKQLIEANNNDPC